MEIVYAVGGASGFFVAVIACLFVWQNRHIIAARLGWPTSGPSDTYVRDLFDGYAEDYDSHLREDLVYVGPESLYQALGPEFLDSRDLVIGDLGCGTGLCGELFREHAQTLAGVDLSSEMLTKARQLGVYDHLIRAENEQFLRKHRGRFNLLLAADVLPYCRNLPAFFAAAAFALKPQGRLAVTVELTRAEDAVLQSTGRYAHSGPFVESTAARFDLGLLDAEVITLREEYGDKVRGGVYVFVKRS